jgi:hypothetical protein
LYCNINNILLLNSRKKSVHFNQNDVWLPIKIKTNNSFPRLTATILQSRGGGQTINADLPVNRSQFFVRYWQLFGLYQTLRRHSSINCSLFDSIFWTNIHLPTSLPPQGDKSKYRSLSINEHFNYCLHLCLSNYEPFFSMLSHDMKHLAPISQKEDYSKKFKSW